MNCWRHRRLPRHHCGRSSKSRSGVRLFDELVHRADSDRGCSGLCSQRAYCYPKRHYMNVIHVEQKLNEGREKRRLRSLEGSAWKPPTSGFTNTSPWPAVSRWPRLTWGSRGRRFESARPDKQRAWSQAVSHAQRSSQKLLPLLEVEEESRRRATPLRGSAQWQEPRPESVKVWPASGTNLHS
jgi:hypothetical protein